MSKKILTIVIPSYNTSSYIDKNLPSFLNADVLDKLEILIINDGSRDNTAEVAKKYEDKYPDTVKLINKENGGHGSVINKGIELASGKYFKVVDGDDWVNTSNLGSLVNSLKAVDADLIINPYYFVFEKSQKIKEIKFEAPSYGKVLRFDSVCKNYQKLPIHAITYKTSVLRENNIKVREHCFYEDNEFDLFPIPYIDTVVIFNYPIYYYLIAQKNQSVSDENTLKNSKMFYSVIQDCIINLDKILDSTTASRHDYIVRTILELIRSQYNIYLRNGNNPNSYKLMKNFNESLKNNYPDYYYLVGQKYHYIKVIQNRNYACFKMASLALKTYKFITMK